MSGAVAALCDLLRLFPFSFAWNEDDVLLDAGPALAKICPDAKPGASLPQVVRLLEPDRAFSAGLARENRGRFFLLESGGLRLRGTLLPMNTPGIAAMLATPWIVDPRQLDAHGLAQDDLGAHDPTFDLLQLLHAGAEAAADLKRRNDALIEQCARLHEQEAHARKLALVAARTDNAVIVTDAASRIEWANEGFTRITGWRLHEVRGKKPSAFLHGAKTDPAVVRYMSDCVRAGSAFTAELINYRHDGEAYWLELEVQPIFDEAGGVANFMAIQRDVTQRKAAEQALRDSEADVRRQHDELEWIYQNAPIGLGCLDRDLRYRRINRWLADIDGAPVEAHLGRKVSEATPHLATKVEPMLRRILATGEAVRDENVIVEVPNKPGVLRYFNECWYPVFVSGGAFAGIGLVVEETTARKRADALSEADQRKNEFLATLAHELRNPLAPIKNALHILQMGATGRVSIAPEDTLAALRMAARQVDHLVRLVDDLLEVARINRGKIELRKAPVDLLTLLPQAVDFVRAKIDARQHRLTLDFAPTPLIVDGDSVRLVQIFANLLDNAAKYTDPGGVIEVTAREEQGEAVVRIRENGIGIPADKLSSIFEIFTQVDYSVRKSQGGIGIGLALVRNLTALHGGWAEARSEGVGRGSEFVVHLPLAAPAAAPEPSVAGATAV